MEIKLAIKIQRTTSDTQTREIPEDTPVEDSKAPRRDRKVDQRFIGQTAKVDGQSLEVKIEKREFVDHRSAQSEGSLKSRGLEIDQEIDGPEIKARTGRDGHILPGNRRAHDHISGAGVDIQLQIAFHPNLVLRITERSRKLRCKEGLGNHDNSGKVHLTDVEPRCRKPQILRKSKKNFLIARLSDS